MRRILLFVAVFAFAVLALPNRTAHAADRPCWSCSYQNGTAGCSRASFSEPGSMGCTGDDDGMGNSWCAGTGDAALRQPCNGVVIARAYDSETVQRIRRASAALTL